jgi:prefoldin subunit 5
MQTEFEKKLDEAREIIETLSSAYDDELEEKNDKITELENRIEELEDDNESMDDQLEAYEKEKLEVD